MSPAQDSRVHTMKPGVAVSCGGAGVDDLVEGLTWTTTAAGGFGSCSFTLRGEGAAPPSYGSVVEIGGGSLYRGRVVNRPDLAITGEEVSYQVICDGEAKEYGRDDGFAMAFRDRDLAQWQVADAGEAWAPLGSDFKLSVSLQGSLRVSGPALEQIVDYVSLHAAPGITYGPPWYANAPPPCPPSECNAPLPVWSAAWYHLQDGVTDDRVSSFKVRAAWDTRTPLQDALVVSDLDNPLGEPDPDHGYRFATYPELDRWTEFYGIATPPGCFWGGIYCCEEDGQLPLHDPVAMYTDTRCLHRFVPGQSSTGTDLDLPCDGKLLCLYVSYRPVRVPVWDAEVYDEAHDHLVRANWYAGNVYYAEPGLFIELTDVEVVCNEWEGDDLAPAFGLIFAECTCDVQATPVDPEATIMVRPHTNRLATIEQLLALTDQPRVWGFYEWHVLRIREDFGDVSFDAEEPGVTVSAQLKVDGAVSTCTVLYQVGAAQEPSGSTLGVNAPLITTVNKKGESTVDGEPVARGQRNARIDVSATAGGLAAAQQQGQAEIVKRGYQEWEGSVGLRSIYGAPAVRAGQVVSCGAAAGALITGTSVNVDSDTVELTLGSHGYKPSQGLAKLGAGAPAPVAAGSTYRQRRDDRRRT